MVKYNLLFLLEVTFGRSGEHLLLVGTTCSLLPFDCLALFSHCSPLIIMFVGGHLVSIVTAHLFRKT